METNELVIRPAEPKDLDRILLLMKKLHKSETEIYGNILSLDWVNTYGRNIVGESIANDDNFISVAEISGKAVAFLRGSLYRNEMLWKVGRGAEIYEIFIEAKFRNQRIGALLMEAFLGWCKERKVDYILVNAALRNTEAIKFYKGFGFDGNQMVLEKKL